MTTAEAGWKGAFRVTTITGGAFGAIAGSGKLAASPDSAKAKAVISRITLTYTAATSLTNAQLRITVPSGFKASAATGENLMMILLMMILIQDQPSVFRRQILSKKGYISSPDSKGAPPVIGYTTNDNIVDPYMTLWKVHLPPLDGMV